MSDRKPLLHDTDDKHHIKLVEQRNRKQYQNTDYDATNSIVYQGNPIDLDLMLYSAGRKNAKKKKFIQALVYIPFIALMTVYMFFGYSILEGRFLHMGIKHNLVEREFPNVNNTADNALRIYKTFMDIMQPDEYFQWLSGVLIERLFKDTDYADEPFPRHRARYFNQQNKLIGALRLRQHRVRPNACQSVPRFTPALPNFDQNCYPAYSWEVRSTEPFGGKTGKEWKYGTCEELGNGNTYFSRASGNLPCDAHYVIIPFNLTYEEAFEAAEYLRLHKWHDRQTRSLIAEFFMYNDNLNYFTSVKLVDEWLLGGASVPTYEFKSFRLITFRDTSNYVYFGFSMLLPVFLIWYVFCYFDRLRHYIKYDRKEKRWYEFFVKRQSPFINIANLMELTNIILLATSLMIRLTYFYHPSIKGFSLGELENQVNPYPAHLETMLWWSRIDEVVISISCVVSWFKIIRFFSLDDRLNLLAVTLKNSVFDLIRVVITLLIVILAFSLSGHLWFGLDMDGFKDFTSSYSTLLRVTIGDSDYEGMKEQNRLLFPWFFVLYMVFGFILVFNMFLAVIQENFGNASKQVLDTGLGINTGKLWNDFKYRMRKIFRIDRGLETEDIWNESKFKFNQGDDEIIDRLKQYHEQQGGTDPLTIDDLRSALKGASKAILRRIMDRYDEDKNGELDILELERNKHRLNLKQIAKDVGKARMVEKALREAVQDSKQKKQDKEDVAKKLEKLEGTLTEIIKQLTTLKEKKEKQEKQK